MKEGIISPSTIVKILELPAIIPYSGSIANFPFSPSIISSPACTDPETILSASILPIEAFIASITFAESPSVVTLSATILPPVKLSEDKLEIVTESASILLICSLFIASLAMASPPILPGLITSPLNVPAIIFSAFISPPK